jgi:hypothetical protein
MCCENWRLTTWTLSWLFRGTNGFIPKLVNDFNAFTKYSWAVSRQRLSWYRSWPTLGKYLKIYLQGQGITT